MLFRSGYPSNYVSSYKLYLGLDVNFVTKYEELNPVVYDRVELTVGNPTRGGFLFDSTDFACPMIPEIADNLFSRVGEMKDYGRTSEQHAVADFVKGLPSLVQYDIHRNFKEFINQFLSELPPRYADEGSGYVTESWEGLEEDEDTRPYPPE